MRPILVTGGTGTLGRAVVRRLLSRGCPVRVLSRQAHTPGEHGWAVGDLVTGRGVEAALAGAGTVVHCATTNGKRDVAATRRLVEAAGGAGVAHLLYVSIVGVDRVPLGYYRAKAECERLVVESGLGWTVLRATQFHDLVLRVLDGLSKAPVLVVPRGVAFQPVDVRDVAERVAQLAEAGPAGRAGDFGGPEVRPVEALAAEFLRARGRRRPVLRAPVPGGTARALRAGGNLVAPGRAVPPGDLVPAHPAGRITFAEFLAERFPA
ncbi:SDR family oxidoreductase [Kitasatospora phosalacinea]|uniref:Nucleotide-diphosphate-sugar epimerase n=1 Tax=Kitasatospora phosalacinea TaxID=2065 RepID=A0A9W6PGX6_9ACTN|nr:NAD(P)H-binding protein [Kitasatospora phosalacinea]GLW55910.1 nucleotide-diphosphate-sugar epimerase [Kitasatospora phosalacinea]